MNNIRLVTVDLEPRDGDYDEAVTEALDLFTPDTPAYGLQVPFSVLVHGPSYARKRRRLVPTWRLVIVLALVIGLVATVLR